MMTDQIQDILEDCLERILTRDESIDSCISRYPVQRAELEPLLKLALQGRTALKVTAPAGVKAASREMVMSHAQSGNGNVVKPHQAGVGYGRFVRFPRIMLKPVALGAVLLALLFGGTAMAASGAEPDSFLYPVKRTLEDVRTAIAFQNLDQAKVEAGHADARLDEILVMVDKDNDDYVPDLLTAFDEQLGSAETDVDAAAAAGKDAAEVEEVEDLIAEVRIRHDRLLLAIEDDIPDEIRAQIADQIDAAAGRESGGGHGYPGNDEDPQAEGASNGDSHGGDRNEPGHQSSHEGEEGGSGNETGDTPGSGDDGRGHDGGDGGADGSPESGGDSDPEDADEGEVATPHEESAHNDGITDSSVADDSSMQ